MKHAVACLSLPWLLVGCKPPAVAPPSLPPAKVVGAVKETELASITLTEAAEQRLAIATATVQERPVVRRRTLGGTATTVPGRTAQLVAPFAARLLPLDGSKVGSEVDGSGVDGSGANGSGIGVGSAVAAGGVVAGATVAVGQPLFKLQPLQPDAALQRASAGAELAAAQAALDAASAQHRRAERLLADQTGSVRAVEEAAVAMAKATADLAAARARLQTWSGAPFAADGSLTLLAPQAGIVLACEVAAGHVVAAGTRLGEIAALDVLWIRVPVHAGELGSVDRAAPARIGRLSDRVDGPWQEAKVAAAPPAADAASATVDLVYELPNHDGLLRPGERVLATLQLDGATPRLVVPCAAILVDVQGGRWVYVRRPPRTFARHAVQVAWVDGDDAVLERGPAAGTVVVTLGAAELFGAEFGQGK